MTTSLLPLEEEEWDTQSETSECESQKRTKVALPRHAPREEAGISSEDRARREAEVRQLKVIYPKIHPQLLEWAWNFHHRTPPDELKRIFDECDAERGAFSAPSETVQESMSES